MKKKRINLYISFEAAKRLRELAYLSGGGDGSGQLSMSEIVEALILATVEKK